MNLTIQLMQQEQVHQVAKIHLKALSDDFLPSLGYSFLSNHYYPFCLNNPYTSVLVALENNQVVGFINVANNPDIYLSQIIKSNLLPLSIALLKLTFFNFQRIREAFELIRSRRTKMEDSGEVAFIAVDPMKQGMGVGLKLVEAGNKYFSQVGLKKVYTKTLSSNKPVINLYKKYYQACIIDRIIIGSKSYVYIAWEL